MEENNNMMPETQEEKKKTFSLSEEEHSSKTLLYWIIGILFLILLGWYGYTAGWFTSSVKKDTSSQKDTPSAFQAGENLAQISEVKIITSEGFPVEKTLVVKAVLPNGCTYLKEPQIIRDGNTFYINLETREEGDTCDQAIRTEELPIQLDILGLPAGVYTLVINGKEITFELEQDNKLDIPVEDQK